MVGVVTGVVHRETHKDLAHTQLLEAEPDVVVLRQALGIKGNAIPLRQQRSDGPSTEAGSHTGAWHLANQRLAHHDILAVQFRELIQIMAAGEIQQRSLQRIDGQLDHVLSVDQEVEQPQLELRQHVFCIVQDEPGKLNA